MIYIIDAILAIKPNIGVTVKNEDIDNIVGILHLKDSNEFLNRYDEDVKDKLLKSYFVAQSTALMKQLKEFQIHDRNMGLVVDEYGEIQGLITIEDIFKEIVGKFGSTNEVELDDDFIRLSANSILTTGNYKIRDINKSESWNISEDSAKTINGLITEYLDFIPQASLCLEIGKYRFEVLEIEDNFISKVKIKREA